MESSQSTLAKRVSLNPTTAMSACNDALTKYDERSLKTHLEDFKNAKILDPELKSFDEMMRQRSKVFIERFEKDGGLSLEGLDEALTIMCDYEEGTTNVVVFCRSQMTTSAKDYSYEVVLKEYLDSTLEMLQFCTDTEKFIDEARGIHSFIEKKVEECTKFGRKPEVGREEARKISDLLNDIMASTAEDKDHTTKKLGERVGILLKKQGELLDHVIQLLEKLKEKEAKSVSSWGKLLNYLYIGLKFIVLLVATIFASIAKLSGWISHISEFSSIFCRILEEDGPADDDKLNSMKGGSLHSLREVGDIQDAINSINISITSLLETATQFANGEIVSAAFKNIKKMLDKFSNKIDDMEKRIEECRTRTRKSRRMLA